MQTYALVVFGSLVIRCLHPNTEDMCLTSQDCIALSYNIITIFTIALSFIINLGILFICLSNPTSDTFFKNKQHVI